MEPSRFNPLDEIRLVASKQALGLIHSWDIPPAADRALSNGVYSDSLLALAQIDQPTMSEVAPLLAKAIAELQLQSPSRVKAAWHLTRHCAERLASGTEPLLAPLLLLREVSFITQDCLPDKVFVGDGLDLGRLIGIYYEYSEPVWNYDSRDPQAVADEAERLRQLYELARSQSREWLARHPNVDFNGEASVFP